MRRIARPLACAALALAGVGCIGEPKVARVYDGRVVEGAFVSPEAYAEYLRGVLAEESGDLRAALSAYERAAAEDEEDPEPLVRVGALRCRLDPKGRGADQAFAEALRIDPTYASALAAKAGCAAERGDAGKALTVLETIAIEDRRSPELEALFVKLSASTSAEAARGRERAIALTLASGDSPAAWDALASWGRGKADGELLARGLEGLVRVAPTRSREVEAGALELLGVGQASLARRVAGAVADAPAVLGITRVHDETVARLAIDEALLRGDADRAERRAVRGHVALEEVAARALILERRELAASLARRSVGADPGAGCASMVLAAIASAEPPPTSAPARVGAPTDRPAASCVLVLAERLAAVAGVGPAREWVAQVTSGASPALAMTPHDPVTAPLAVDLAARGVIAESALPLEQRLELAARRREPPPPVAGAARHALDAKHMLLWQLLTDPKGTSAKAMLARMAGAADRDPIIGFALARAALASSASGAAFSASAWAPVLRAVAASPTHPLLLAVAVELARIGGRAEDVPPARARLMAVARTPAERALAAE